jgi:PAS domain S-box-containing protein
MKTRTKNSTNNPADTNPETKRRRTVRLSIKGKMVLIIMIVSLAAMLLAGGTFIIHQYYVFRTRMVQDLSAQAEMVADNCTGALSFDDPQDAAEVLGSLKAKPHIAYACVFRGNKTILAQYHRYGFDRGSPPPVPEEEHHHFFNRWLCMSKNITLNGRHIGTVYIESDLSELKTFIRQSIAALTLMVLLTSIVAYILSSRLQKVISTPIFHLEKIASDVSHSKDYSVRAVKHSEDEFGRLTDAFNNMMAEVEKRDRALSRLRNLLTNTFDSMPSIMVGVDGEGRVTHWNREAENNTGTTAAEARGRNLKDVFPQMAGEMKSVRSAIQNRGTRKNEKVPRKVDGQLRYSDVTVYPLIANGVEGAVIRVDDVTERVRIEEMMIQTEKMLSVGGLAAGMAHEINNPLAGILQNVQVMRNRMRTDLDKNIHTAEECGTTMETINAYMEKRDLITMIDAVLDSGRRAAQIVENMLSFSRKSESRFKYSHPAKLLDKTIELVSNDYDLKKKYDFRKIKITRQYDPDVPKIFCEGSKLQQVFLNILKNGAHAMAEYREKKKGRSRFILRVLNEDDVVRIEIEDNGPGMAKEVLRHVFEPFFTTKGVGLGTGLGLSVSYFIITENHKGTMTVESTPGKGSTFIMRLPVKRIGLG